MQRHIVYVRRRFLRHDDQQLRRHHPKPSLPAPMASNYHVHESLPWILSSRSARSAKPGGEYSSKAFQLVFVNFSRNFGSLLVLTGVNTRNSIGWMSRSRHPNKEIERVIQLAEQRGWTVRKCKGHAWGRLLCPFSGRGGCQIGINSTPKVPENHARQIRREVENCPHTQNED